MENNQTLSDFELLEQEIRDLQQKQTGLNEEVFQKLKAKFNQATECLGETAMDFNFQLRTAIENTKNDENSMVYPLT